MNLRHRHCLGILLATAGFLAAPMPASAALVSTDQVVARQAADAERAKIQAFVDRVDAAGRLRALGIDVDNARSRIAALSDEEAHVLAARIDSLPTGGNVGSFTDQQVIIVLLLLILLALVL